MSKAFGNVRALRNMSLQLHSGEIHALVGENGAGKSTLVKTLAGVHRPDDGRVLIDGAPVEFTAPVDAQRAGGAVIVGYDSNANRTDVFVNQSTNRLIGQTLVGMVEEQLDGEGAFAVLSATPNATNQNAWIEEMEQILKEEEYSDLELVDTVYGNDDDLESFQEMQGLMQSHPNLDAVVSPTTVGLAAVARYVSDSEYQGELVVTGLGTPNQMREFVHDGTVDRFALWNPHELGYLAGYTGAALKAGRITGAQGETFTGGDLGEFTFETDREVVLGPPLVFDADNVDDFDF